MSSGYQGAAGALLRVVNDGKWLSWWKVGIILSVVLELFVKIP
jgi:hypothetical protein